MDNFIYHDILYTAFKSEVEINGFKEDCEDSEHYIKFYKFYAINVYAYREKIFMNICRADGSKLSLDENFFEELNPLHLANRVSLEGNSNYICKGTYQMCCDKVIDYADNNSECNMIGSRQFQREQKRKQR
ncbi:MAG: hypothetical protein EOP45_03415, partial [Sphingobacteriaceae bacterium]